MSELSALSLSRECLVDKRRLHTVDKMAQNFSAPEEKGSHKNMSRFGWTKWRL